MRRWWPRWTGRIGRRLGSSGRVEQTVGQRGPSASRARVARAAEAARDAQAQSGEETGTAMARVWLAREIWPHCADWRAAQRRSAPFGAFRARTTASAASVCAREPAEEWAEVLAAWLTGREAGAADESLTRDELDARRARDWQMIDTTLGQLRAS